MDLLNVLIWIVVVGAIFGLLWWLIDYLGLPAPFHKIAKVIIAVVAVIILVNFLLGIVGVSTPSLKLR